MRGIGSWRGDIPVAAGPLISLRHPRWTSALPRQDISILVFTVSQWNDLAQERFHIGAASVGPSELGRNGSYAFALPARYEYALFTGYEEVAGILSTNPQKQTHKPVTPFDTI